jgi:hypothetical protein
LRRGPGRPSPTRAHPWGKALGTFRYTRQTRYGRPPTSYSPTSPVRPPRFSSSTAARAYYRFGTARALRTYPRPRRGSTRAPCYTRGPGAGTALAPPPGRAAAAGPYPPTPALAYHRGGPAGGIPQEGAAAPPRPGRRPPGVRRAPGGAGPRRPGAGRRAARPAHAAAGLQQVWGRAIHAAARLPGRYRVGLLDGPVPAALSGLPARPSQMALRGRQESPAGPAHRLIPPPLQHPAPLACPPACLPACGLARLPTCRPAAPLPTAGLPVLPPGAFTDGNAVARFSSMRVG